MLTLPKPEPLKRVKARADRQLAALRKKVRVMALDEHRMAIDGDDANLPLRFRRT